MATAVNDFFLKTGTQVVAGGDAIPSIFGFFPIIDAPTNTLLSSEIVNPTNLAASTPISIVNGQYRINGGAWVSTSGTISTGDSVQVRHTTSSSSGQIVTSILDINGVKSLFTTKTA